MHDVLTARSVVVPLAILMLAGACASENYVQLYRTESRAPSYTDDEVAALTHLGPTTIDQGINFGVYSENATRVDVLLFAAPNDKLPTRQIEMQRFGDVWNIYIEGVGIGQHYGYVAWGPNWPFDKQWFPGSIHGFIADVDAHGNRFNPNKLLFDPYAKAMTGDHDWSGGSTATGPARTESTWSGASKSIIVESAYEWSPQEAEWRENRRDANWAGHRWQDLIIYEVHAKGFTADAASGVEHPGTYRGFAEHADYLADLGITAVELMPVHEKPSDGGYWGYQTMSFFAPETSYSSRNELHETIDEFKMMVDELHKRNIEVILDVVYNHTGEGGLWREKIEQDDFSVDPTTDIQLENFDPKEVAGLYAYRGLDNQAWYALSEDGQTYWNNTGVGNQTRPNHRPMRKLIIDSLRYWVEEMHVDGFRFDLAPVLGEVDGNYNSWDDPANTVLQDIIDDPVLRQYNTRVISEPWSIAHFKLGAFPTSSGDASVAWYDWNANFRDLWRSFINYDDRGLNVAEGPIDVGGSLTGSSNLFGWNDRKPYHSVNFVTVHDGFTMFDLFSFEHKKNGCGVLNPRCCDQRLSPFCDIDSGENHNRSRDWTDSPSNPEHLDDADWMKRQQMRNLFVAMMISHGTPMLFGGDEWMRTQYGNNNAYSSGADSHWNWFNWGTWNPSAERHRMHDFVRKIIAFRKQHGYAFAPADYASGSAFAWKGASGGTADWSKRHIMIHHNNASAGPELLILLNMEQGQVDFTLPTDKSWTRIVDTQSWFDDPNKRNNESNPNSSGNITLDSSEIISEPSYGAAAHSIVIMKATAL